MITEARECNHMTMDERINRINELYHKSKTAGLNEDERAEQARLRREYIDSIKASVSANMEHVSINSRMVL